MLKPILQMEEAPSTADIGLQSLPFYQKYGYEVFGILENCPHGHKRYFLKKQLVRK